MWPKMLLEFLPHLTRLIPAADTYLSSRKQSDKAHQAALADLTAEVRGGFAKAAEEQSAFRSELQAHIASSAHISSDLKRLSIALDGLEGRARGTERRLTTMSRLLWTSLIVLVGVLVAVAIRTWR